MASMKIYGIAEIAREIGANRETVAQWHRRNKLPLPDENLAMGPVWKATTIRPWIHRYALHGANRGIIEREWVTEDGYRVFVSKFTSQTVGVWQGNQILEPCVKIHLYKPWVLEPEYDTDYTKIAEEVVYGQDVWEPETRNLIGGKGAYRANPPKPEAIESAIEKMLDEARRKHPIALLDLLAGSLSRVLKKAVMAERKARGDDAFDLSRIVYRNGAFVIHDIRSEAAREALAEANHMVAVHGPELALRFEVLRSRFENSD